MTRLALTALCATLAASPALAAPVTSVADARPGMLVTVTGIVSQITDEDEFLLADPSGSILIYVGPDMVPAAQGETVVVTGLVDDDPGPPEIYAQSLTRADGSVVTFAGHDF